MKKSLLALAVLGLAGAAAAQSSVTLYGLADVGVGKARIDGDNKLHMLSGSTMSNLTSRVGVRGAEDLGGGTRVGFQFETGLSLNDGVTLGAGGGFWGRQANLWIGGSWGTLTLGRALTPSYWGVAAWELTGQVNYSVVGNTYQYADDVSARNSSQFSYTTPDFGGLTGRLGYVLKDDHGGRAKWDLGLSYANGPIGAGLSANKTRHGGTNWALGGKYNFGPFALAASYSDVRNVAGTNLRRRGFSLGGQFVTGPFTATLDLTRDTRNELGAKKYTNGVLEGKYALSRRTFLYAAYLRFDGENNYGIGLQHSF